MPSNLTLHIVVAPVFATNCCLVVADSGDAIIVDAGAGVMPDVVALVEKNGWQVQGVAATHGHADHTWDAGPLCAHFNVPFFINEADKYRIADPIGSLQQPDTRPDQSVGVAIAHAIKAMGLGEYQAPTNIVTFDSNQLKAGGVELDLIFAPGHTQGSTLYLGQDFVLSGDVLFAGSIGRTDLPGGDGATMTATLKQLAKTLNPKLTVIPGHGPATTVERELASNPYWRAALVG